jgi:hypothetical protein
VANFPEKVAKRGPKDFGSQGLQSGDYEAFLIVDYHAERRAKKAIDFNASSTAHFVSYFVFGACHH